MKEFKKIQTVLGENFEKEKDAHPDFRGEITLFGNKYRAAAWLKHNKKGQPCVGLSLRSSDDNVEDINLTLWQKEKENRATSADPHFKVKETIQGEPLVFCGWITFQGEQGALRIEVTRSGDEVTDAAKENRKKLAAFLKEADGVDPTLLIHGNPAKASGGDLDVEPDDIPF
jgi:hypothetical protein